MLEGIVLPRMLDAAHDVLHFNEKYGHDGWERVVLDFADAFKQLWVDPAEHKHLTG